MVSDPIAPPAAQYEPGALLRPWADDLDGGTVRETMASLMQLRLPLDTTLVAVLPAEGLAMLVCERRIDGTGPDGRRVRLRGTGCTVVRPQPDGSWRIAADAWQLSAVPVG
jgi:ketosteroid isomerase-like protein